MEPHLISKVNREELTTIIHYTGFVTVLVGLFMIIPIIISYIFQDSISYTHSFIASSIICIVFGASIYYNTTTKHIHNLSLKGSLMFVMSIWLFTALFVALPFIISGDLSVIDAYFEAMSGITSTGFTMYQSGVMAYSIAIWRSLLQWFGGLGIIFLILVIVPSSTSLKRLYFAEGKTEQMTPNIKHTANIFIKVYAVLTFIGIALYLIVGLDLFDAVCYTFTGLGTGGFSVNPNNLNNFSNTYVQLVTMLIMIMGGTNFILHYRIMKRDWKNIHKDIEVRYMVAIITSATILIGVNLWQHGFYDSNLLVSLRHALFQVISILTSTGFSTTDINNWTPFTYHILILLMFIGGSVCSTAGGIKLYNIAIMLKSIWWETKTIFLPKHVILKKRVFHDKKQREISNTTIQTILVYIFAYIMLFVVSTIIVLIYCQDFQIAYAIVAGSVGNTGLGPSYINTQIPTVVKIVLIIDFWGGRIGIWPILLPVVYVINTINKINK